MKAGEQSQSHVEEYQGDEILVTEAPKGTGRVAGAVLVPQGTKPEKISNLL